MMAPIAGTPRLYELPSACIVGAGPSGLTAAKALQDRGIPFDCFERADRIGGLWALGNRGGNPSAYRSLQINTSKERTQLEDLPMPDSFPDFPSREQIAPYLESYAERFRLRERITLETAISHAEPLPEGGWSVELEGGETRRYDALVVASGHHWDPLFPEPAPGSFDGETIHSRDYLDPEGLEGRSVVVVGLGNSAMDIAVDVSRVAATTLLSARRGAHILPRRLGGRPLDQLELLVPRRLRPALGGRLTGLALRAAWALGWLPKAQDYGLPSPAPLGSSHPTVSDLLFDRIAAGAITPKPAISRLEGEEVLFADGSRNRADLIVYCTGYRVRFPFLDPEVASAPGNDLPLFHRVFKPDRPGLCFIGLVQPLGPTIRMAEVQSKWLAAHLAGEYALPGAEEMERAIASERARLERYLPSPRHTMQVDWWPYMSGLAREMRRGRRRAARRAFSPQLPARAPRAAIGPAADAKAPELSVVLPASSAESAGEAIAALATQSASDRIELVLVGPSAPPRDERAQRTLSALHSVKALERRPLDSLPLARAAGVEAASCELVAFCETHSFPDPGWAEALIATHRGDWAAVGPELVSDNPGTIGDSMLLINYAPWAAPARPGAVEHLPGHNSCYKRELLLRYGPRLGRMLEAESVLHWDLRDQGASHYLQPAARVRHRNLELLRPALAEHFHGARSFAAARATGRSVPWRLARALACPLLPAIRLGRALRPGPGRTGTRPEARLVPMMALLLCAAAAGEAAGYLTGGGNSVSRLVTYELDRDRWMRASASAGTRP